MGGLDTSGIDDTKIGSIFSPSHPSDDDMKGIKQLFKHALQFPFVEVVKDGVKGREVPRKHTPLAPRFDYVHDSINNVPKRVFSFAMLWIQDNFSNLPLFISEVSWILTHNFMLFGTYKVTKNILISLLIFSYLHVLLAKFSLKFKQLLNTNNYV